MRPSLGALALKGGFLELARVGMGNGGSFGSVRLGLLALWCEAMPLWIMADRRMTLDFVLKIEGRPPRLEPLLPKPDSRMSRIWNEAASKPSASSDVRGTNRLLVFGENAFSEEVTVPTELRLPARLGPGLGLGAESAVRYSESLRSASINSSTSSELFPSKPANKLLIRGGLRIGAR